MESGEDEMVAQRLRQVLGGRRASEVEASESEAPANVSGVWQIQTQYVLGHSSHSVVIEQNKLEIKGIYTSSYSTEKLEGDLEGNSISFHVALGYEANITIYRYKGTVVGDSMSGRVALGEFGEGTWHAEKIGSP